MPVRLFEAASGRPVGTLTEAQFQVLMDELEEESPTDRDYYINTATVDMLEEDGADPALVELLRQALAGRGEMDLRWELVP